MLNNSGKGKKKEEKDEDDDRCSTNDPNVKKATKKSLRTYLEHGNKFKGWKESATQLLKAVRD